MFPHPTHHDLIIFEANPRCHTILFINIQCYLSMVPLSHLEHAVIPVNIYPVGAHIFLIVSWMSYLIFFFFFLQLGCLNQDADKVCTLWLVHMSLNYFARKSVEIVLFVVMSLIQCIHLFASFYFRLLWIYLKFYLWLQSLSYRIYLQRYNFHLCPLHPVPPSSNY